MTSCFGAAFITQKNPVNKKKIILDDAKTVSRIKIIFPEKFHNHDELYFSTFKPL